MPPGCRPASLPDLARRRQARRDQQQPQAVSGSVAEADGGVSTADAKLRLSGSSGEVAAFKPRISSSGSPAAGACSPWRGVGGEAGGGVQATDTKPQIYGSRGGEAGGGGQAKQAKLAPLRRSSGEAGGGGQANDAKLRC
ncbi:hypothetical protein PR002_g30147 [Phytophthora rubi]|uniref:Uncharacterized protein n=1 Tax=Phytophthora rubi TaxID=129364 RepID=A0A6A3GUT8_9STRA|nr:hypothetical protein PR002_g30147 [Phytophthora rubi]